MRLLVIEDEQRVAGAIKRSLEAEHFAVDLVHDADNGLGAALDSDYDLIILDRTLPGTMSGMEVCNRVRSAGVSTPIIMLTALGEVDDRVQGLRMGADDYMVKPFSMQELLVRVQVILRRPTQTNGPLIRYKKLCLNTENYEVTLANKPVALSAREFKLLAYLMYHKEQIVSKDTIINHVWDGDSLIMPNTVEVYIAQLRKKLRAVSAPESSLIQTVHGFGYKIGPK